MRVHVVVRGRVQNVTFRASTQRQAEQLGVAGWARNLPDGSVEAELEGRRSEVDQLLGWMHTGPLLAGVDDVDVTAVPPRGDDAFEVR